MRPRYFLYHIAYVLIIIDYVRRIDKLFFTRTDGFDRKKCRLQIEMNVAISCEIICIIGNIEIAYHADKLSADYFRYFGIFYNKFRAYVFSQFVDVVFSILYSNEIFRLFMQFVTK